ncbi:MAG: histidine kinase N-terminal 7TM domain-containing protein, partial [Patescibacteria group bacterium]
METVFSLNTVVLISTIAINILLAFFVYKNDSKSATNVIFSLLTLTASIWLLVNYVSVNPAFLKESLLWIRLSIFFAVLLNTLFFLLAHTVPYSHIQLRQRGKIYLLILTSLVMIIAISPYSFTGVEVINGSPNPVPGPGIALFGAFSIFLNVAAVYVLAKRLRGSTGVQKQQLRFVTVGTLLMFGLIIATIFLPVLFFKNNTFVPFFPIYTLIFIAMSAYAIIKHHLFNIKVIAAEALTVGIWIALLSRLVVSKSLAEIVVNLLILSATIVFGFLLIKSVRKEVEQREQLQKLSEELKSANIQLEELSHFKTQLLSLASHQVKSPLAAMKGFVSLIIDGTYGEVGEKVKETLGKVKKSADGLIGLINTLLDVRKVEEGKMDYQFAPTDLVDVVSGVVEELKPLAGQKKLEFAFTAPAEKIVINADATKLKQVILNIADNAIKYTPATSTGSGQAGFVKIAIDKKDGSVVVSVTDSGLGISQDLLPHLFEE